MSTDKQLVSTQEHELNYLLEKWEKRKTAENRKILAEKIHEFKAVKSYAPHNRENFYKYVASKKIKKLLESKNGSNTTAGWKQ